MDKLYLISVSDDDDETVEVISGLRDVEVIAQLTPHNGSTLKSRAAKRFKKIFSPPRTRRKPPGCDCEG